MTGTTTTGVGFHAQLRRSWDASGSLLCVGLDPDPDRMPEPLDGDADAIFRFCTAIVDATADLVCAFKPQFAHFASQRAEPTLERLCTYIRERYPECLPRLRGELEQGPSRSEPRAQRVAGGPEVA